MTRPRPTEPVHEPRSQASGDMPDRAEKSTPRGSHPSNSTSFRNSPGNDGFSAGAVPLRPAAERSGEREREERLRLLTTRPTRRLPGGRRRRLAAVAILGLVLLVVGGALALGRGGGHESSRSATAAPTNSPLRHSTVVPDAQAGRPSPTRVTASRRHHSRAQRRHPIDHHRRRPRGSRSRPDPRSHKKAPATAPVPTEVPTATEVTPPAEASPAPETTPVPEPAPAAEAAQPTSTKTDESPATPEPSTLERQFGFER
jgi:hypothetical protein